MPKGGARIRSGPAPDPRSERSERRGYRLDRLPAAGFEGSIPDFPLPEPLEREVEVWDAAWRTPQGCAWSMPTERWRWSKVALWVRVMVRCESQEAPATLIAQLHRLADDIGMTTAGLAAMGWVIVPDLEAVPDAEPEQPREAPVRRLRQSP